MKPPSCGVCASRFDPDMGGLVAFADYEPLPSGLVGHPAGRVWFCERHLEAAQALKTHDSSVALRRLRLRFWLGGWLLDLMRRR